MSKDKSKYRIKYANTATGLAQMVVDNLTRRGISRIKFDNARSAERMGIAGWRLTELHAELPREGRITCQQGEKKTWYSFATPIAAPTANTAG